MSVDLIGLGTLFDSLERTRKKFGELAAYEIPARASRAYHPAGWKRSWSEIHRDVLDVRAAYARAGYGFGHRVAILFEQRPEFVAHFFALNSLGVSVVPLNFEYRRDEIAYVLEHSESQLVLGIDSRLDDLRSAAAVSGGAPVHSFDRFAAQALPAPRTAATAGTPDGLSEAALLYTSGTTGRPKGCVLTNEYFHTFGHWYTTRGGRLTMGEGCERMYNPLPLHHANCLSISLPAMLLLGGCLIFPDRFSASTFWHDMIETRATCVQFQGVIPNILLKLPQSELETRHSIKFALCAGVEPSQHPVFESRYGIPLVEMWAMTETGRFLSDHLEPRETHTRAFGRACDGFEARVIDENGRDVADGTPGELVVRHSAAAPRKGFFSGYLKNPEATEQAWRDGWYHTGDVVSRAASGMMYFVDRSKNIVRRSGENIGTAEVEACLVEHERVLQAAVVAVPDELREEEVMACIVVRPGSEGDPALARELLGWCSERLAYFKAPGWFVFLSQLPTTSSQKVHKIKIFGDLKDPRLHAGAIDLRDLKRKDGTRSALAGAAAADAKR